jgi:hypothetical protein
MMRLDNEIIIPLTVFSFPFKFRQYVWDITKCEFRVKAIECITEPSPAGNSSEAIVLALYSKFTGDNMFKSTSVVLFMIILPILLTPEMISMDMGWAVGTWKQNTAQIMATVAANPAANIETVKIETQKNGIKLAFDMVDSTGKLIRAEFIGRFDGKDYAVTGLPYADTVTLRRIDSYTVDCSYKKEGKVVKSERVIISKDGMRATVFQKGKDAAGVDATIVGVWDRQ